MRSYTPFIVLFALSHSYYLHAAVFKTAEVTRVLNDVRVVQDETNTSPARIGDVITGNTALATGVGSRAELKFPDQTLTRLGANTLFRLEEGTRDIDLQQGVLLLQVPKQLGGARVRTAAVTAAVTGTTILVEYEPNGYIKVIVIEGELDLFMNDKPSVFTTIKPGDMIIMKPDAKSFPLPVQVDLKRLIKTSKLLNPDEFGPVGNGTQIDDALKQQDDLKDKGELLNTAFMLPGTGTRVTFTNEVRRELLRFQDPPRNPNQRPPSNNGNPGSGNQGSNPATAPRPFIPGTTYITDNDPIVTNPHITAYNSLVGVDVTSQGSYYESSTDGTVGSAIFGLPSKPSPLDSLVDSAGRWAAFHFEDLVIVGNPTIDAVNGARNLLLASDLGIALNFTDLDIGNDSLSETSPPTGSGQFEIDGLENFMLAAKEGSIAINGNFNIRGTNENVLFQTFGTDGDITITGGGSPPDSEGSETSYDFYNSAQIDVPDGTFNAAASRDIFFNAAQVRAGSVNLTAKRDITIANGSDIAAKTNINLIANGSFSIESSSQLRNLGNAVDPLQIYIAARGGDLSVINSDITGNNINMEATVGNIALRNSSLSAESIRARTMGPNGQLVINGGIFNANSAIKLYAEGSNGTVQFVGNTTLNSQNTSIAAKTVQINQGVNVSVGSPTGLRVYTDNRQFSNDGGPSNRGSFTNNNGGPISVPVNSFGSRPSY